MKNEIEINGRKYDAVTGKLLNGLKPAPISNSNSSMFSPSIDGVRKSPTNNPGADSLTPKPAVSKTVKSLPVKSPASRQVVDGLRKKPQKSVTLARKIVKKPTTKQSLVHAKSSMSTGTSKTTNIVNEPFTTRKAFFKKVPDARLARAISQKTSSAITRFSTARPATRPVINHNLHPKEQPKETVPATIQPIAPLKNTPHTAKPVPVPHEQVFEHKTATPINAAVEPIIRPFHKKAHHRLRNRRYLSGLVAACFAILLLFSFLAYQRIPQVAVKVAARNAGFDAKVPSNIPSGYSFKSPVKKTDDSLAINYKSNTDSREFKLTQKQSSWTSESLLSNFIIDGKKQYQAYYDKGMTVFVYDNSNATWVDKGVWFTLETNGSLSSEQILSIASSI